MCCCIKGLQLKKKKKVIHVIVYIHGLTLWLRSCGQYSRFTRPLSQHSLFNRLHILPSLKFCGNDLVSRAIFDNPFRKSSLLSSITERTREELHASPHIQHTPILSHISRSNVGRLYRLFLLLYALLNHC